MKKEEIDQLRECLKDKDKRIKKLEERYKLRNSILMIIGWTILCFSWMIYIFIFSDSESLKEIFKNIVTIIGVCTTVVGTFVIFIFGGLKILE